MKKLLLIISIGLVSIIGTANATKQNNEQVAKELYTHFYNECKSTDSHYICVCQAELLVASVKSGFLDLMKAREMTETEQGGFNSGHRWGIYSVCTYMSLHYGDSFADFWNCKGCSYENE